MVDWFATILRQERPEPCCPTSLFQMAFAFLMMAARCFGSARGYAAFIDIGSRAIDSASSRFLRRIFQVILTISIGLQTALTGWRWLAFVHQSMISRWRTRLFGCEW